MLIHSGVDVLLQFCVCTCARVLGLLCITAQYEILVILGIALFLILELN